MVLPRRRRLPLSTLENIPSSSQESHEVNGEPTKEEKVKRKRGKRRKRHNAKFRSRLVSWTVLAAILAAFSWKIRRKTAVSPEKHGITSRLRATFGSIMPSPHASQLKHNSLYNVIHQAANRTQALISPYEKRPLTLASTYGTEVTKNGCNLTVVFMDPRLATAGPGEAAWFSLESVGAFLSDSCVLLQTATCAVKEQLESSNGSVSDENVFRVVTERIYDNALPLFRRMIEQGKVRVTIPNHAKYKLKSCSDYGHNPSSALMNINYWKDEFIYGVDNDRILFIQDDAVLCHSFDVDEWKDYAFVGSVWAKKSFHFSEGMCHGMLLRWNTWVGPQRRWENQQKRINVPPEKRLPRPDELLDKVDKFPDICSDDLGPVGNGGLSLRSRSWLIKVIETCPHVALSAVDFEGHVHACKVFEEINEDLYFGIVLRGIGAPLPTAYEASLFSTEMLWPEQVVKMYGAPPSSDRQHYQVHYDGDVITMPAGVHKPWWYQPSELLFSNEMDGACPFLKYILPPKESSRQWKNWQSLDQQKELGGIIGS